MSAETDKIWSEFHDRLRNFILSRVRNESDADDILQDVFLRIHKNMHSLEQEDKVRPWIYQIARNAIVDHYRAHQERMAPAQLTDIPAEDPGAGELSEEVASCLGPMINRLPDPYRQAVLTTELSGRTQKDAAEELGLSVSGMKSRVQRARQKLRDMLLDCCHFELDRRGTITDYWPKDPTCRRCSGAAGTAATAISKQE